MSLDVHLHLKGEPVAAHQGPQIFIREDGQTREITREEWSQRFPGREPVTVEFDEEDDGSSTVFSYNITHNLGKMADEAGIYYAMWRPEERGWTAARDLIEPLRDGLALLQTEPERFKALNPDNGWGDYGGLVRFAKAYLEACMRYPEAEISVSR